VQFVCSSKYPISKSSTFRTSFAGQQTVMQISYQQALLSFYIWPCCKTFWCAELLKHLLPLVSQHFDMTDAIILTCKLTVPQLCYSVLSAACSISFSCGDHYQYLSMQNKAQCNTACYICSMFPRQVSMK
jgi:hypothetical protein